MARRLMSTMVRMQGGPTRGGTGTRINFYTNEALTVFATIYQRSTGAGVQPNPLIPNAGVQQPLLANRVAGDAFVTVPSVASFNVGDLIPIYDAVNAVYRVITIITPATGRLDLDSTLGFAFNAATTKVNNNDMRGHIWGWFEDTQDYYFQPFDVASGRPLPPLQLPIRAPSSPIDVMEEGVLLGNRPRVNFIGGTITAVDDAGNNRFNVTVSAGPDSASYVTTASEAGLTNENVLGTAVLMKGTFGARPAASVDGRHYWATDDTPPQVYRDTGGTWERVAVTSAVITEVFTASGTWTKRTGAKTVEVICIGAGGGGGGGHGSTDSINRNGGAGGGAGAFVKRTFDATLLGATESVTIGAGGTAGVGGTSVSGTAGGVGGTSTFGALVSAYGGGGGRGADGADACGGGGGGSAGAGTTGSTTTGPGGAPFGGAPDEAGSSLFRNSGSGAYGGTGGGAGGCAEYGGGGGGSTSGSGGAGGSSKFGAGAGGGGGGVTSGNVEVAGAAGGKYDAYVAGGGGAGGGVGGAAGTAGTSRSGKGQCGDGGGGGGGETPGFGGVGGAGGAPGGGGGGGGGGGTNGPAGGGGNGGLGTRGEVLVVTYF